MKKLFILLLVLVSTSIFAQEKTFKLKKPLEVEKKVIDIVIEGKTFEVVQLGNGNQYFDRTSTNGNVYRMYLGYVTKYFYEGKQVYTDSKNDKYWYLTLTKTNYPKKVFLLDED